MSGVVWTDEGTGPVVVLLHAFPCDRSMWSGQVEGLVNAGWRVMVPDLPGFGDSPLPEQSPSLTVVVESLVASLLERSVDRCVVVGLSVGGYLIMEWLRRYPEMLAGVGLCDTKASADGEAAVAARLEMASTIDIDPAACAPMLRERLLPVIVGDTTTASRPDVLSMVANWMDSVKPATVSWYQRAMAARPDSLGTLGEIDIPALIVWGDEDVMSPRAEQDAMAEVLRDGRVVVIPAAGHLTAVESASAVTNALAEFLNLLRYANLDG